MQISFYDSVVTSGRPSKFTFYCPIAINEPGS
jgi:hypothetical protein